MELLTFQMLLTCPPTIKKLLNIDAINCMLKIFQDRAHLKVRIKLNEKQKIIYTLNENEKILTKKRSGNKMMKNN